jgi:alpha-mannosidase
VDTFGHPATLPQILCGCGLDCYVFLRPGPHEKNLPAEVFWWEAPDGSRVLAHRIAGAYTTRDADQAGQIEHALAAKPAALSLAMCFFGVGNHGGGPTRRQIEDIRTLTVQRKDIAIRFSNPARYFDDIRHQADGLPVVSEELQPHAVGCYSANSALKRAYRLAECRLLAAERVAAMAAVWLGSPAPLADLQALWRDLCTCQFHDTLCGTTTKEGADDAIMALGRIALGAQEIKIDAARDVASRVDTSGPGSAVLIFNAGAETYEGYVEYEPWTDWEPWGAGWQLTDDSGQPAPHQLIETHEALSRADHGPDRLVFPVVLPAMGYRLYRFSKPETDAVLPQSSVLSAQSVRAGTDVLANDQFEIRLDPRTGDIVSCFRFGRWVRLGRDPAGGTFLRSRRPQRYVVTRVRRFEDIIGRFDAPSIRVVKRGRSRLPCWWNAAMRATVGSSSWCCEAALCCEAVSPNC